jgi:hypothetical protein
VWRQWGLYKLLWVGCCLQQQGGWHYQAVPIVQKERQVPPLWWVRGGLAPTTRRSMSQDWVWELIPHFDQVYRLMIFATAMLMTIWVLQGKSAEIGIRRWISGLRLSDLINSTLLRRRLRSGCSMVYAPVCTGLFWTVKVIWQRLFREILSGFARLAGARQLQSSRKHR